MSASSIASTLPDNLADLVGNTPMVRLTRVAPDCGAELVGKLEAYNPAGSVKDRIGVSMIDAAEAEGASSRAATRSSRPPPATPASRWRSCAPRRGTTSC